jgi:hypothetical protein
VSGYEAPCPSCGGTIVFSLGSTLLKVCDHCGSAVARKGADLKAYGKVASLIPTPSVLALGVRGGYEGAPPFELVGRLQLGYASGTWDEWLMAFSGGTWAWLSESQGKFHYMGAAPLPPVPEFEHVRVGETVDLGPPGTFVITEKRTARFVTAQGELPFDVAPGSALHYADLSGPGGQFATLDYGTGQTAEALYVGREVSLDELGMRGLPEAEERRKRVAGAALSCPNCGGPLEIRVPDQTQRVACPYCGSLLDATKDLAVLQALSLVPIEPQIPLGSKGTIDGTAWTVIGFMERSVTVEGTRYPWREYLLYEPRKGFRWLVESKGHWSFVEPINAGDARQLGLQLYRCRDRTFKHFQGGQAVVDHVVGEFYWAVALGDTTESDDYVSPPFMLSSEKDESEINWSYGTYKTPEEIWTAFGLPDRAPAPQGIAPHQPSPFAGRVGPVWAAALLALGLVFSLYLVFLVGGGRTVHKQSVIIPPAAVPGSPEAALFTDRFFIESTGNVEVRVNAPLSNSWLYLDGALIDEETGAVDEFDLEASYYFGSDSDGAWSEGGGEARTYVSAVPPGRYVLRLAPQWDPGHRVSGYDLEVRSRIPRFYQALLAALLLLFWPIVLSWRAGRFEAGRWSESDHAFGVSTSSSDSSDEGDDE